MDSGIGTIGRGNPNGDSNNDKAIQQGHISDGLSSKFGREYDDDWNSHRGRKRGKELSTDKAKSQITKAEFLQKMQLVEEED